MSKIKEPTGKHFIYEPNRRVYSKFGSAPAYEKHFVPMFYRGMTSRSFIFSQFENDPEVYSVKVPKKIYGTDDSSVLTEQQKDDRVWTNAHRYKIQNAISRCTVKDLRKIAGLIGYNPN